MVWLEQTLTPFVFLQDCQSSIRTHLLWLVHQNTSMNSIDIFLAGSGSGDQES